LFAEGERILAQDHSDKIASAEISKKDAVPDAADLASLSTPLLESLERLAGKEHRKRAGLIQLILWDYVFAHVGVVNATKPAKPRRTEKASEPKETAAHTNGRKVGPKARAKGLSMLRRLRTAAAARTAYHKAGIRRWLWSSGATFTAPTSYLEPSTETPALAVRT
jgi:hypothetical protein